VYAAAKDEAARTIAAMENFMIADWCDGIFRSFRRAVELGMKWFVRRENGTCKRSRW
jgi:hypothetical protein